MVIITAVQKNEEEKENDDDDDEEKSQIIVRNPREVARVFGSSMTRNEPQECHSIILSLLGSPPPQATLSIDSTTNGSTQRSAIRKIKILTTQRGEKFFPMRRK
ncbi:hypothetical protein T07_4087 [Trichinella nelsoni]|uniref:Uncharacterized protein n=3 Tax=Trichinella TaxID=6333 RepID=A0A0V1LQR4_9BILA|nr:hypothetical protein T07_4087 [Trichinella nelsoni]KRY21494.1 hypothetical protein T12_5123 [Trichinella patagoniensis]KRZ61780.1 hypothetical protein T02_8129 [Trichinella nativa]